MNKTISKLLVVALCVSNVGFVVAEVPTTPVRDSLCTKLADKAAMVKKTIADNAQAASTWVANTKVVSTVSVNTAKVVKYVTFQHLDGTNKDLALRSVAAAALFAAIIYGSYKLFCPCAQDNCVDDVEEVEVTVTEAPVAPGHSTMVAVHATVNPNNSDAAQLVSIDLVDVVETPVAESAAVA